MVCGSVRAGGILDARKYVSRAVDRTPPHGPYRTYTVQVNAKLNGMAHTKTLVQLSGGPYNPYRSYSIGQECHHTVHRGAMVQVK